MAEKTLDLPQECWELIFSFMAHRHQLSPISLVCKTFLSITDDLVKSLDVSDRTAIGLPSLLRRFARLRAISFAGFRGEADDLLSRVANSGLDIESLDVSDRRTLPIRGLRVFASKMKNLRSLNCSKIGTLCDEDLDSIASAFPLLEELDVSHPEKCGFSDPRDFVNPVSDAGVLTLSFKLTSLRKIILSGNHFITDKSLEFLSTKCLLLTQIALRSCDFVTHNGVALLLRHCPNMNSVSACGIGRSFVDSTLSDSMIHARALRDVDFRESTISDELLRSMARASLPLNKLALANGRGFTFHGISFLLSKIQSVQHLDLEAVKFLRDESMAELSKILTNLTHINLSFCKQLTDSTLFSLTRNCPSLIEVKMVNTSLGVKDSTTLGPEFVPNKTRIKHLYLAQNRSLDDNGVKNIATACPNLETLELSRCPDVTEEGIFEALKRCPKIRRLEMNRCGGVKSFVLDCELPKLEVLCASESRIDDEGLGSIGKKCPRILELDLSGCLNVTAKGVKEIGQNCGALREINLKRCNNVNIDIVAWMVFSRPSLKRIVSPCGSVPSESQRSFFLRHGCLVCEG